MTEQTELCQCGDRPRTECPGEWEPGCDLGANEKFARRAPPCNVAQVDAALKLPPTAGSRWTKAAWGHGTVAKVLGVVENWVVYRRKGTAPSLLHVNQWHDAFAPAVPVAPKKKPARASGTP